MNFLIWLWGGIFGGRCEPTGQWSDDLDDNEVDHG